MAMYRIDFRGYAYVNAADPGEAEELFEADQFHSREFESIDVEELDDWDLEV